MTFGSSCTNLNSEVEQRRCKAAGVGQTFSSASWDDFPVAPRPDQKVRRTGRLEGLPHIVCLPRNRRYSTPELRINDPQPRNTRDFNLSGESDHLTLVNLAPPLRAAEARSVWSLPWVSGADFQ